MLTLSDLKGLTQEQILNHLLEQYADSEQDEALLKKLEVLIAYESVGAWGCDSSSFFLVKDEQGNLFEIHGSHCSCHGFEGQLNLEETSIEALKFRIHNAGTVYYSGGYDDDSEDNQEAVRNYILSL